MYKYSKILFMVAALLITSGCMSVLHPAHYNRNTPTYKRPIDQYALKFSVLTTKLKLQGVRVIEVGETVSIVIPSDPLFQGRSANLDHSSFYRLNLVADYLRLYSKTFVEVAGYTDNSGYANCVGGEYDAEAAKRDHLLTSQQAAQVAHYLWSKGIDSRMLNALGYGSEHPISNNNSPDNSAKNRRIEIHFQYNE